MSRPRPLSRLLAVAGVLALTLTAGQALAGAGLRYSPGPTTLYMPTLTYYQVHASLVNTGDAPGRYHLSVRHEIPEDWTLSVCYGGICYPPSVTEFTIPTEGTVAPGEAMAIDLDVTKLVTEGNGTFVISIQSLDNPALADHVTYAVYDPTANPVSFFFAPGTTVLEGEMEVVTRFHTALFNNGTQDDAYSLTVTRNQPFPWSSTVCFNGVCYAPDQSQFRIPEFGEVTAGGVVDIDIDFSPFMESGTGSMHLVFASETNPQLTAAYTFYASTEGLIAVPDGAPTPLLGQAYAAPNPFNPQTQIRFEAGVAGQPAQIDIYDLRGRQVRSLGLGAVVAGSNSVTWDGRDAAGEPVAAGAYMAQVRVGGQSQLVKMSLVK